MSARRVWKLQELATLLGATLQGDAHCEVSALNTLQDAEPGDLSFLANPVYQKYLSSTRASAVILDAEAASDFPGNSLICAQPYLAYAQLSGVMDTAPQPQIGVHPSAFVHESATLGADVSVGPSAHIAAGAILGDGAVVGAGCSVGADSVIGRRSVLHANVTLYHGVSIGDDTIIHSGAVIGADGFGFAPSASGWKKIHQLGGVQIGHRVEIGACSTIDRGALGDTRIGDGVIIDNQVQIAHNVQIGDNTAIAGCTGIAGSTTIGRNCLIAGASCIIGHIEIVDNVQITAVTFVNRSITKPGSYSSGTFASDTGSWKKNAIRFGQLDRLASRLASLEKKAGGSVD